MYLNHPSPAERILFIVFFFVFGSVCGPVGVEDRNKVPDARMTASAYADSRYHPHYGRLNENRGDGAWCAMTTTDYLQVDMGAVHSVCAVATQGVRFLSEWTTSYKVHLSTDGVKWNSYKENNVEKVSRMTYSCLGVDDYREITKSSILLNRTDCIYHHSIQVTAKIWTTKTSCYRLGIYVLSFELRKKKTLPL